MQQRIIPLFFLIIFLCNSPGYYFIFKVEQYQAQKFIEVQIKSDLPAKELVLLSFNPSSAEFKIIEWMDDHEFSYNGRMYDIVKQVTDSNGIIHYYCINDLHEEQLFDQLAEDIKRYSDNENGKNKSGKELKKDNKDYFLSSFYISLPVPVSNTFFSQQRYCFNSVAKDVSIPPPRTRSLFS